MGLLKDNNNYLNSEQLIPSAKVSLEAYASAI